MSGEEVAPEQQIPRQSLSPPGSPSKLSGCRSHMPVKASVQKHQRQKNLAYYIQADEYFMKNRNTIWAFPASNLDCVFMCKEVAILH
ncbi:hypothetical protein llap_14761 [Limosa lapponica baueri]|uniref:Uncharacterized protein n=1 Tax=Limosa lapponica baueri TaxID=1758121 RepID=A0A2I0TMA1_LIMLA|nr:hypothetical protein llap_14761 [Limosa lapponica baueri]